MRILLIEDDQLIGDGLNIGLNKLGFSVDWFQNGLDGREHHKPGPPESGSGADKCGGGDILHRAGAEPDKAGRHGLPSYPNADSPGNVYFGIQPERGARERCQRLRSLACGHTGN